MEPPCVSSCMRPVAQPPRLTYLGQHPVVILDSQSLDSACDLRAHLRLLREEARRARETGLSRDPEYAEDLADDLACTTAAHVAACVVALAQLRRSLGGPSSDGESGA